jgi:hypothetical protein
MTANSALSVHSSELENVLEHLFIGEMLRTLWCKKVYDVAVLRSEVDNLGYDLVVECRGITRHIQLKSTHKQGRAKNQKVNSKIEKRLGGCAIWMFYDLKNLKLGPFRFWGVGPGEPTPSLGCKIARHTKGNNKGIKRERPNIRIVSKGKFKLINSMSDLIEQLFGDLAGRAT